MKRTGLFLLSAFLLLLGSRDACGQRIKVKNLEKYDKQWIHFGFLLGFNTTDFRVTHADDFYKSDSVLVLEADGKAGFNLGIIANLHINNNLDLRFVPDLAFSQRDLVYKMTTKIANSDVVIKKVESTFLEFPLELKFKSNRVNNYRFYVTGGFRYMIDLVSQAKVENQEELVKLERNDFGYSIGLGMDLYLPLFKFAPEIKMFQGIPNVLTKDPAVYSTSISALKSRIFTFSLTFE
ncbi:MAG: PorT family protein [Bacteroidia bacterium]|nr:PorT family protein [Bacteroidia bacterium]